MIAETILVGTELLLGNIVNTNGAYLAAGLSGLGIDTYYQTVVGDNAERLKGVIEQAVSRSNIVILSGGLGPTQDDITKEVAAEVFGKELKLDEHTKERIVAYFEKLDRVMSDNNFKQAMIPDGAIVLDNDNGTAPGIIMTRKKAGSTEDEKEIIILLPGPPHELEAMFEEKVVPYLSNLLAENKQVLYSRMIKVCGRSESEIAELLDDLINKEGAVTVAPYAKTSEVHVRVTAKAEDEHAAKKLVKPIVNEIKNRLGDNVYTTHEETTLEQTVVDLLIANNLTITTVESCTGGLIAGRLINVPGVSEVYKSGEITYSNKAKRRILGVKKSTLQKHGAVSSQVVKEMCLGAAFFNRADVAIAVSGIAGPDGGSPEKPVGLVYIGCNVCGQVTTKEYHLKGNREKVRNTAVAESLILLRQCILEYYSKKTFAGTMNNDKELMI